MRKTAALTIPEAIIALAVIAVFLFVLTGGNITTTHALKKGQMTQTLSNMRQLYLATQSAVLDGQTGKETNLGWPGDHGSSFSFWAQQTVPSYLGTNDFCKLLSAPGRTLSTKNLPTRNTNAVLLYAVRETSGSNSVFLSTANFTNTAEGGLAPIAQSRPYGTDGFVVFRKDGKGDILKNSSAGNTTKVGAFVPLCE